MRVAKFLAVPLVFVGAFIGIASSKRLGGAFRPAGR
jgi:hypothetical protein